MKKIRFKYYYFLPFAPLGVFFSFSFVWVDWIGLYCKISFNSFIIFSDKLQFSIIIFCNVNGDKSGLLSNDSFIVDINFSIPSFDNLL